MYCPKCGSEIPDNAATCPNCNSELAPKSESAQTQFGSSNSENNGDGGKNKVIIFGIAGVAVVILIFIISLLFRGSYKDPVKELVKLCNKREESLLAYDKINQPDFLADYNKVYTTLLAKSDYGDDYKDEFEYVFDSWEDTYGDNFKLTIEEIKDVEKIDKDDLEDYQDDMREYVEDKDDREDLVDDLEDSLDYYEDEYDLSSKDSKKIVKAYSKMLKKMAKVKVTKGYEMDIEIKIKGKDGSDKYKEKHVEILKVNGDWIFAGSWTPGTLYYNFD